MVGFIWIGLSNKVLIINQWAVSSDIQFAQLAAFKWLCFVFFKLFYQGYFHLFVIFPLPKFFPLLITCKV